MDKEAIERSKVGIRFDEGKPRFDLIPAYSIFEIAKVFTIGEAKYCARNWEKGMPWGKVVGAILRHVFRWMGGEDLDPESGLHHMAHAAWGCMVLIQYSKTHKQLDDRSPYHRFAFDDKYRLVEESGSDGNGNGLRRGLGEWMKSKLKSLEKVKK